MEHKKIKICHIASSDITLKFMLQGQLRFLKSQGYEVYAVCSDGKWVKDIENQGIKVKTILIKRKMSPISDLITFFKLFIYFRKEKFQIIHTHTLKPEFWAQIAGKLAGVQIIINTIHGFDFGEETSFLKQKSFIRLEKIAAKRSDIIFSVSKAVIRTAIKEKICQPHLLKYLGRDIDTNRFNPKRFTKEFILNKKKQLSIDSDKKIIGIVARLVEEKGYLELFEAFKNVLNKFPNTLLLVVGFKEPEKKDPINLEIVKKYNIQNNVIFLEERIDVDELYSLMDIFVLPTHREGIGASILEASAMKRPVIATNTGGCSEAVDDGKTGILVSLKDVEGLSQAIIYLLSNPEKSKEMGRRGREKILKEFNQTLIFSRMKTEYDRLIRKKLYKKIIYSEKKLRSDKIIEEYKELIIKKQTKDFEKWWQKKFSEVAEKDGEEHEILLSSESGLINHQKYFFRYFKPHIKSDNQESEIKVLDVGCGTGTYSKFLARKGFKVTGVDFSREMISLAKKKSEAEKINFRVANIYNLPFKDNSFDIVICIAVFQSVLKPKKALREIKRVLNNRGLVVIITLNGFSFEFLFKKDDPFIHKPFWFKRLMLEQGFNKIKIKGIYFFPQGLNFFVDFILKFRIFSFLNLFFPIFKFVSHSYYIEGRKEDI